MCAQSDINRIKLKDLTLGEMATVRWADRSLPDVQDEGCQGSIKETNVLQKCLYQQVLDKTYYM